MNDIRVTVELCQEDRARLDAILDALQKKHDTEPVEPETLPEQETPEEEPDPNPMEEKAAPKYTHADLMMRVTSLIQNGKKAEAKTIVTEYAPSVSAVPADKIDEVMEKLAAATKE